MRAIGLSILGIFLAVAAFAQYSGGGGGGGAGPGSYPVSASPPTSPTDGQVWKRSTDKRLFTYDATFAKWLGEIFVLTFNRTGVDAVGGLAFGNVNSSSVSPFVGYDAYTDSMRVIEVRGHSNDGAAPACTTYINRDALQICKLVWDSNEEQWLPGSGSWIGNTRIAIGPGQTLGLQNVTSTLPCDNPVVFVYLRAEVAP